MGYQGGSEGRNTLIGLSHFHWAFPMTKIVYKKSQYLDRSFALPLEKRETWHMRAYKKVAIP